MTRAWKGALLSGLVFPGLGQLWLRSYLRGAALIIAVSAALGFIVVRAAGQALEILQRMEAEGTVDMVRIAESATRASLGPGHGQATWSLVVLALCWVAGTVDAYLTGSKIDAGGVKRGASEAREMSRGNGGGASK